ncbi:hypothetical protein BpHYR1_036168 [Brachionus plicatilis]|uniref:Uncharacterized protein n=1 Tax=Brachionus plicatilis TaxID=10195 RepID=A0A3M7PT71_BRAPC|nr:hypothetical protein BpHYR1_036168 [Brachionus plicatilis]
MDRFGLTASNTTINRFTNRTDISFNRFRNDSHPKSFINLINPVLTPTFGNNVLDLLLTEAPGRIFSVKVGHQFLHRLKIVFTPLLFSSRTTEMP